MDNVKETPKEDALDMLKNAALNEVRDFFRDVLEISNDDLLFSEHFRRCSSRLEFFAIPVAYQIVPEDKISEWFHYVYEEMNMNAMARMGAKEWRAPDASKEEEWRAEAKKMQELDSIVRPCAPCWEDEDDEWAQRGDPYPWDYYLEGWRWRSSEGWK